MKYRISSFLSLLVSLGFLLSCAQALQQVAEKTLDPTADIATQKAKDSTVRLVSRIGRSKTLGSGFFVDTDKIATTIHVVAQPGPVFAKFIDKKTILAVEGIAAFDVKNNLVILKLSGEGTPLPTGNSDTVQKGESVSVVGYPDGKYDVTTETIDSIQKSDKWFWMKVATSKESSGGPVLNNKGQVIGINVGYGDDSHNYVIPSNALKALLAKTMPLEPLVEWRKRETIRAERHYSQGEQKSTAKDYKNAIAEFDKAIELNPEHVRAYYKRGRVKSNLDDYTGAIDDYTYVIKLNPEHVRSYSSRGAAKFRLGESKSDGRDAKKARHLYQEAIADWTQAIKIDPDNARAYKNRSVGRCKLGDTESAHGDAEKAQRFYYEGIADFDKSIQLKHQESTDASTAHIEKPSIGRASTVRVIGWSGASSKFSVGSGFFVDTDKIATNIHVVARPGPVFVKLSDKEDILAIESVTAFDVKNNLVILKLAGESKPLPIGDSDPIHSGESVSVIGFSNWKDNVTSGTIDSILKSNKWFWIKVATSEDGSGGPVLNSKGQVVGVAVGYGNESHSYAIPSNTLSALLTQSAPLEPLEEWQSRKTIRAELRHSQGEIKYFAKDYNSAIVDFDEAIELNPKHVRAYYKRGNTKSNLADYADAIEDYTHAIRLNHKHARAYNNSGNAKINLDDYAGAIDDYTHAIMIDPENANYYHNRSITRCKLGDTESVHGDSENARRFYHKGIADYDKYFQLKHPEDTNASTPRIESKKGRASTLRIIGWSGVSSGFFDGSGFFVDTDKIATNIHVVARPGPVFAKLIDKETIWEVVGVTAFDVGNDLVVLKLSGKGTPLTIGNSNAVQIGESVVAVGYPSGNYKVSKGEVHYIRNRDKWLLTTANTSPGSSGGPMLNSKGEVIGINAQTGEYTRSIPSNTLKTLLDRSELTEGLADWRKRESIYAYAYVVEGHIKHAKEDYDGAITDLDKAIQLNPEFAMAYYVRANVYESRKDYMAAMDNYDKAIELNPEDATTYQDRGNVKRNLSAFKAAEGNVAEAQKFYQAAIDDYTLAIKNDPEYAYVYFQRGLTRHDLGKSKANQGDITEALQLYQAAIDDYTHAIKIDPKYNRAYRKRGKVRKDLEKVKKLESDK